MRLTKTFGEFILDLGARPAHRRGSGTDLTTMRHHLAVVYRSYLKEILSGRKKMECRLGRTRCLPFDRVSRGDLVWFKEASGPVRAVVRVTAVEFRRGLTPRAVDELGRRLRLETCTSKAFWRSRRDAKVVTLMRLGTVCRLKPFRIRKRDRRSWVILDGPLTPDQLLSPSSTPSTQPTE